jgi:hypothetical protein
MQTVRVALAHLSVSRSDACHDGIISGARKNDEARDIRLSSFGPDDFADAEPAKPNKTLIHGFMDGERAGTREAFL